MIPYKDEALRALANVRGRLMAGPPLDGLELHRLRATVEYAIEQVGLIQETKRQRRAPAAEAEAGP